MTTYTVQGPTGKSYTIDGPEGATAEQLGQTIMSQVPDEAKRAALHAKTAAQVDSDPISQGAMNFAKDMPWYQQLAAGAGKAVSDLGTGISQRFGGTSTAEVDAKKQLDAPLMRTGMGVAGNIAGNVAAIVPAAFVPGANGLVAAGAIGGITGALQPTGTGDSVAKNVAIGAAAGSGGAAVLKGIGAGYRAIKAAAEPFTAAGPQQIAGRTIQRFADNPNAISGATSTPTITGAVPTLAEQTGDVGIARLQDALRASDPQLNNAIGGRLSANNAARVDKLNALSGTGGARDFAVAERQGTAGPMYDEAFGAVPDASLLSPEQARSMATLMKSPAIQSALKDAQTIAKNNGTNVGPANATGSIEGMHNMKLSMDDAISAAKAAGNTNKAASIQAAQKQLVSLMEGMSPEYANARQVYAQMSQPINSMDIAAQVAKRGLSNGTDLATGSQTINRNALLGALKDEPSLIRQATGRPVANAISDVMKPDDLNMLRTIASEADRAGAVQTAGNGTGSATAQRLASQNILRQIVAPNVVPAGTAPTLGQRAGQAIADSTLGQTVVGKATNWLYSGIAEPRIQEQLAKAILQPSEAKAALDAAARANVQLPASLMRRLTQQAAIQTPAVAYRSTTNP